MSDAISSKDVAEPTVSEERAVRSNPAGAAAIIKRQQAEIARLRAEVLKLESHIVDVYNAQEAAQGETTAPHNSMLTEAAEIFSNVCQLMDGWKITAPNEWTAFDQEQRDRISAWSLELHRQRTKLNADTGGGCSICRALPVVNVSGTYWLCGPCVDERLHNLTHSPEPSAYLKLWEANGPRCRVDLSETCEPWLERLKPIITPLYARLPVKSGEEPLTVSKVPQ